MFYIERSEFYIVLFENIFITWHIQSFLVHCQDYLPALSGKTSSPLPGSQRWAEIHHPLRPTWWLAHCSWQGSGLYSYLLYRVVSQTLKLYKLLPQPGIRQKETERWKNSSGCTRDRKGNNLTAGHGSKAANATCLYFACLILQQSILEIGWIS